MKFKTGNIWIYVNIKQKKDEGKCATQTFINYTLTKNYFVMTRQPLTRQALLIAEVSRSYSDTQHSVGLLWTSDQPNAETSTCTTNNSFKIHASMTPSGFETSNPESIWPQTHAFGRAVTGVGRHVLLGRPNQRQWDDEGGGVLELTMGTRNFNCRRSQVNPLNTKRRLLYLKTQFVPRSEHFSSRL